MTGKAEVKTASQSSRTDGEQGKAKRPSEERASKFSTCEKAVGTPIALLVLDPSGSAREVGYVVRWNTGDEEPVWCERLSWWQKRAACQAALPGGLAFQRAS